MNLITGHNLIQPSEPSAPLEFDLGPGDAELIARCASAVTALRPNDVPSPKKDALTKELEAAGFQFVEAA